VGIPINTRPLLPSRALPPIKYRREDDFPWEFPSIPVRPPPIRPISLGSASSVSLTRLPPLGFPGEMIACGRSFTCPRAGFSRTVASAQQKS